MKNNEEQLFDLLEQKEFSELNDQEKVFVLRHLSEDEYQFQRQIIVASSKLVEDADEEPLPLVLPVATIPLLQRGVPMYQVLLGAACLLALFFTLLLRKTNENSLAPVAIAKEKPSVQFIYDTVVKEVAIEKIIYKTVRDTIHLLKTVATPMNSSLVLLNPAGSVPAPTLNDRLLQNNSVSALHDESTRLLQHITVMNQPIGM